jgi:hypothetical protein
MKFPFLLMLALSLSIALRAQSGGIRGTVKGKGGEILPFATILIRNASKGTIANEEGKYQLSLPSGSYEVVFQYLSYKSQSVQVTIGDSYQQLDAQLEEQVLTLGEVKVSDKSEDPAYAILRKAISMAPFHRQEVASYQARTYVKANVTIKELSGMVKWMAGKQIDETGIKVGQTYVMESINDISFTQPGTVREKVVSNRSNLPPQIQQSSGNQINFTTVNFYQPKVMGTMISPLSPVAFTYYKVEYLGMFEDRGVQVNKIKLIPRSKDNELMQGTLNITEGTWAIHSLDVTFKDPSGQYALKQLYAPFEQVWMPVYLETTADVDLLGIKAGARYVTNVRNYQVRVDPRYKTPPVVLDKKADKQELEALKSKPSAGTMGPRQLKKYLKEQQKAVKAEQKAADKDVSVVQDYQFEVDTLASKRPASFWETERQVPLTNFEVKAYVQADSIAKVDAQKRSKDSVKNLPHFKVRHIFIGKAYNYGKQEPQYGYPRQLVLTAPLSIENLLGNFYNSVEGYYLNAGIQYNVLHELNTRLEVGTSFRYSFVRERLNGTAFLRYRFAHLNQQLELSGGRFVQQFNAEQPINPFINAFYSLLQAENFMKLYEREFAAVKSTNRLNEQFTLVTSLEFSKRTSLPNYHTTPWNSPGDRRYTSNVPQSLEVPDSLGFKTHRTFIVETEIRIRPFAKAARYNQRAYTLNRNKPTFYLKGRAGLLEESRFTQLEAVYDQTWELQRLGDLRLNARIGTFPDRPTYLIDFKHFNGNQTLYTLGRFDSFRDLRYYQFSTSQSYWELHANNDFQRLLLTWIVPVRLSGVKENLFFNYFNTFDQGNRFMEVGYGFKGGPSLLGMGLETGISFLNETYQSPFFRIRLAF